MKPKTFMLIAGALATEQRTVVAHSASYGICRPRISKAPAGAEENCPPAKIVFRAIRRLKVWTHCSHSASYGSGRPQMSQAPAGATENFLSPTHFSRPARAL